VKDDDPLFVFLRDSIGIPNDRPRALDKLKHDVSALQSLSIWKPTVLCQRTRESLQGKVDDVFLDSIAHLLFKPVPTGTASRGIPMPLFKDVPPSVQNVIKQSAELVVLASACQNEADRNRVVKLAEKVPKSQTRRDFEAQGWQLDGLQFYGTTPFTSAFRVGKESKEEFDPKPYLVKLVVTKNEKRAAKILRRMFKPDELAHLVPTRKIALDGKPLLIMPHYVRSLAQLPTLTPRHVFHYISPVFELLKKLWDKKIFHCDIKPANIFLTAEGSAVLGDMGSVQFAVGVETESTEVYIPKGLQEVSGEALDAGMLLMTCVQLLGWNELAKQVDTRDFYAQIQATEHMPLRAMLGVLYSKVTTALGVASKVVVAEQDMVPHRGLISDSTRCPTHKLQ